MKPAILIAVLAVLICRPAFAQEPLQRGDYDPLDIRNDRDWEHRKFVEPPVKPDAVFLTTREVLDQTVVMALWQYNKMQGELKTLRAKVAELEAKASPKKADSNSKLRRCPGCAGDRMAKSGNFQWCCDCDWDNGLCRVPKCPLPVGAEPRAYQIQCGPED